MAWWNAARCDIIERSATVAQGVTVASLNIQPAASLAEAENALFATWRKQDPSEGFTTDGAIDPDEYARSPIRLVFLLKETNGWTGDLRSTLRNGEHASGTWYNLTRWIEGILQLPRITPWSKLEQCPDDERRQQALRKVVVVNLKKTPGGSAANDESIRYAAKRDRQLLSEQLALYAPHFVICCGDIVGNAIADDVYQLPPEDWQQTHRGVWYIHVNDIPYVSVYHPAAHLPSRFLHYGLIDALNELRDRNAPV